MHEFNCTLSAPCIFPSSSSSSSPFLLFCHHLLAQLFDILLGGGGGGGGRGRGREGGSEGGEGNWRVAGGFSAGPSRILADPAGGDRQATSVILRRIIHFFRDGVDLPPERVHFSGSFLFLFLFLQIVEGFFMAALLDSLRAGITRQ